MSDRVLMWTGKYIINSRGRKIPHIIEALPSSVECYLKKGFKLWTGETIPLATPTPNIKLLCPNCNRIFKKETRQEAKGLLEAHMIEHINNQKGACDWWR